MGAGRFSYRRALLSVKTRVSDNLHPEAMDNRIAHESRRVKLALNAQSRTVALRFDSNRDALRILQEHFPGPSFSVLRCAH